MSTKITYNSKTTEVANGKIATLSCSGKKMATDVVIEVPTATDSPLPTEVSTEAEMTTLLTSGEVGGVYKYTGTTGTYENGALYVLEAELIYFSVDLNDFTAEKGMTWGEWKESSYNTAEIRWLDSTDGTGMQINLDGTWYFIMNGTEIVGQDETIVNNCLYTTKQETATDTVITAYFKKQSSSDPDISIGYFDTEEYTTTDPVATISSTAATEITLTIPSGYGVYLSAGFGCTLWTILEDGVAVDWGDCVDPLYGCDVKNGKTYTIHAVED